MNYPNIGDKLWFAHDGYPIVIRVTVMNIHHGEVIIDEPVEFNLDYEDLCWTLDEATDTLFFNMERAKEFWSETFPGHDSMVFDENYTLEKYRDDVSLTLCCQDAEEGRPHRPKEWLDKEDDEWFSIRKLREMRGMTRGSFEELYRDA